MCPFKCSCVKFKELRVEGTTFGINQLVTDTASPTDSAALNSASNPSDLSSANSAMGGAKKKKKRDKTDGGTANGSAGGTSNGSTANNRLNVPTSTGKAQKRKKIR